MYMNIGIATSYYQHFVLAAKLAFRSLLCWPAPRAAAAATVTTTVTTIASGSCRILQS
jgi:hypothetical protein